MAVPIVSSAEGVLFGGFKRLVASFRMAGVALRDIQTCFVSCRKCSLCCSHVSRLESLVFLWLRRVYGASCKTSPFRRSPTVKIGGSLARNARFAALTCLVSSLWFSCGLAVSMGDAAKPLLFGGFQAGCHTVLRGKRGIF